MIIKRYYLSMIAVCICYASPSYSSDNSSQLRLADEIEEIVITGTRSLGSYRREAERAENYLFDVFNDLVEDREFQVVCRKEGKTGSHLRKRVCEPRFIKTARRKERFEGQPFSNRGVQAPTFAIGSMNNRSLNRQQRRKFAELEDLMIELSDDNQELMGALEEANKARETFESLRERRFEED